MWVELRVEKSRVGSGSWRARRQGRDGRENEKGHACRVGESAYNRVGSIRARKRIGLIIQKIAWATCEEEIVIAVVDKGLIASFVSKAE